MEVIRHTLAKTTQLAKAILRYPLRRHVKSRFPQLNRPRLCKKVATDTYFANCCVVTCAQVFYGMTSHMINMYGLRTESKAPEAYADFLCHKGAPPDLRRDNSKVQSGCKFQDLNRLYIIGDQFTKPYHPQQNPSENRAVCWLKTHIQVLLDRRGAPPKVRLAASQYLAHVHNVSSDETLNWEVPLAVRHGDTPNISALLHFQFYEKVYYLDPSEVYPDTKEKTGYWLGIADNVGDSLTYSILTDENVQVIQRSVVRPFDPLHANQRLVFSPDLDRTQPSNNDLTLLMFADQKVCIEPNISRPRKTRTTKESRRALRRLNTSNLADPPSFLTAIPIVTHDTLATDILPPKIPLPPPLGAHNPLPQSIPILARGETNTRPAVISGEPLIPETPNATQNIPICAPRETNTPAVISEEPLIPETPNAPPVYSDPPSIQFSTEPLIHPAPDCSPPTRRSTRTPHLPSRFTLTGHPCHSMIPPFFPTNHATFDNYEDLLPLPRPWTEPITIGTPLSPGDNALNNLQLLEYHRHLDNATDQDFDDIMWMAVKVLDHARRLMNPADIRVKVKVL